MGSHPLALIDDVINAVNDIMYKCTQAMETYLNERQQKRLEETMKEKNSDEDVVMEGPEDTPSAIPDDETTRYGRSWRRCWRVKLTKISTSSNCTH